MRKTAIIALLLSVAMLTACASDKDVVSPADSSAQTSAVTDEISSAEQTTAATTTAAPESSTEPSTTTTAPAETTTAEVTTTVATEPEPSDEPAQTAATTTVTTAATTTAATTVTTTAATTTTPDTTTTAIPEEEEIVETKYIALTFDDGPNTTTTAEVLDKLEKYDIVASFFLIGNNINDDSAKVVKRAYDMGCEIHNHSKTHSDMTKMTADEIKEEFTYTDDKIYEITGERSGFFRPPYIAVNEEMLIQIDVPFIAGIGCNDWDDKVTAERRAMSILRQAKDGDIILLHDAQGNSQTVEALDTIIPELQKNGYKFVTVTELFEIKGIEISGLDTKIYTNVLQKYMYN